MMIFKDYKSDPKNYNNKTNTLLIKFNNIKKLSMKILIMLKIDIFVTIYLSSFC